MTEFHFYLLALKEAFLLFWKRDPITFAVLGLLFAIFLFFLLLPLS